MHLLRIEISEQWSWWSSSLRERILLYITLYYTNTHKQYPTIQKKQTTNNWGLTLLGRFYPVATMGRAGPLQNWGVGISNKVGDPFVLFCHHSVLY
jgi:hypothetical protein